MVEPLRTNLMTRYAREFFPEMERSTEIVKRCSKLSNANKILCNQRKELSQIIGSVLLRSQSA